MKRNISLISCF